MPYEIVKSTVNGKTGYRVRKVGTRNYFSKYPMTLQKAKSQMLAIIISENK